MNETIIDELDIPNDISFKVENGNFTIKGPKGEITKNFQTPFLTYVQEDGALLFIVSKKKTQREKKLTHTIKARLKNYFRGVCLGHTYKLKMCSGHFPMSVAVKGNIFEIKNFIGESVPRRVTLKPGATVTINGDEIAVDGFDIDIVSQTAADIETLARRPGFDKRIFMDGIWIIEKDGEKL